MDEKRLRIYMQDHLAGATAGEALAQRTRENNQGTTYGDALGRLADEISADKRELEQIMDAFGFGPDRAKNLAFLVGAKAGGLKPNGQLRGYSPLSRVTEMEGLIAGISGKLSLWRALAELAPEEPRLDAERLERLMNRGEEQRRTVEELRTRAVRAAFLS